MVSSATTAASLSATKGHEQQQQQHQQQQQKQPKCSQTTWLIVLLGATAVLSTLMTVWQAHSPALSSTMNSPHQDTAIHVAIQEFMQGRQQSQQQRRDSENKNSNDAQQEWNAAQEEEEDRRDAAAGEEEEGLDGPVDEEEPDDDKFFAEMAEKSLLAGLSCVDHGGPSDELAQEMVYWSDIPSDALYVSPFAIHHARQRKNNDVAATEQPRRRYMTFEPDGGGWNNIRMALETTIALAIAMGRTLVLPPEQRMYLLAKNRGKEKTDFSFADFFPLQEINEEMHGLEIISMQEFLELEAMTGHLTDKFNGQVSFPPDNRTDWNGQDVKILKEWLRNVTMTPHLKPDQCMAAFPSSGKHEDVEFLRSLQEQIKQEKGVVEGYLDHPAPVDAPPLDRMKEHMAHRTELCVYNEEMQTAPVIHLMCYHKMRVRLLTHSYAFLFFENWREDLWMKRFIRDHMRYIDEIQCAAARIVVALREHARKRNPNNPNGDFDSFHIRRGDFQFKRTRIPATEIYSNTKGLIANGTTLYIATDEHDKSFFDPLREHYDLLFLDDFKSVLGNVNTNYFGMIDQLVASRGKQFFGCWHSTFTGYIMRIRGYHSVKDKAPGHEDGLLLNSYYYVPTENLRAMHKYAALGGAFFNREFPTSWRDIDKGIGELNTTVDLLDEEEAKVS